MRIRFLLGLRPLLIVSAFWSCAPTLTSAPGRKLAENGTITAVPLANAIRVSSKANLLHQGKRLKFDVWIEADSAQGRLDALGPFGTPLATVIWKDSSWKAWLPGQGTLLRGTGNAMNLPVLGLKEIRPADLIAPLLGRVFPRVGPLRVNPVVGSQTMILPDSPNPTWSLLIDPATGLPSRRQTLSQGREVEGLSFYRWSRQGDVLVPGTIDRTTPDGQLLQFEVQEWKTIPEVPATHLDLVFHNPVDTITLTKNARGQPVYRIRTAVGNGFDSATVLRSDIRGMAEAPLQETELQPIDTLSGDETDSTELDSMGLVDESDDELDAMAPAGMVSEPPAKPSSPPKVPVIPATIPEHRLKP